MDEERVIRTIKRVMPAVVSIVISKHLEDLEREMPHELYSFLPGEHHRAIKKPRRFKIPESLIDSNGMVSIGGGSGFSVAPGLILTNKHVVTDANASYTVILDDGAKLPAEVVSRDPINDVAILRIPDRNLPAVPMGDARKLQLGQTVIAIGNALGIFKNTVSLGIVSGLSRSISAKAEPNDPVQEMRGLIQTDAGVNIGNSGGPRVDLEGRAIGVNAAISTSAQGIGFAIPINAAHRDVEDILKYGRIERPFLGVRYVMIDEKLGQKMGLPVAHGALVISEGAHEHAVTPGGPAKGKVKEGDIILEIDGARLEVTRPIQDALENKNVGDAVSLLILRGGETFTTEIKLAERI
ncbi:MAG: trypsin-like peptidase domain-containing protein [Patescibacteria group bacterium]